MALLQQMGHICCDLGSIDSKAILDGPIDTRGNRGDILVLEERRNLELQKVGFVEKCRASY